MHAVGSVRSQGHRARIAACAIALVAAGPPSFAQSPPMPSVTFDRLRSGGPLRLGYRADARPFSYRDDAGNVAGFAATLCTKVAEAIKSEPGLASVAVEWIPLTAERRFLAVRDGQVDLLCAADSVTLSRRKDVAFSIPTFPSGIGALVRADAPARLREVLRGRRLPEGPAWRAPAGQLLQAQTFAVVRGTTAEPWLAQKMGDFQLTAQVAPVASYDEGIRMLIDRKVNVVFGDRAILLDAAARVSARDLIAVERLFTIEPLALALPRGDEDFRLVVDRTLSKLYASGEMSALYAKWFGEPDETTLFFFRSNALPD